MSNLVTKYAVNRQLLRSSLFKSTSTSLKNIRPLSSTTPRSNEKTPVSPSIKATSIINSLPGSSILSKTGILVTGAAASVYAISNELYVISDESILVLTFLGFMGLVAKYISPLYGDFANERMNKVSSILNSSREKHMNAVKERIEDVKSLDSVVDTTKLLFDVSRETVELEAEAFELQQRVELATEAKSVLDSWVRHEDNIKKLQQKQLVASVKDRIESMLGDSKFQEQVLNESVTEIENLLR
ncbi:hypothetical protein TBLA_0H03660 [Henningerozyma blattae CBS 6284]|uniref:ATP synthase subunit 4 n=1 Tax=Henningerozyma blattae (strain ATCC 34711 / CBS 6284 / DSM 70876 / NBRC 10599 / NRRL Y-10934 / UCD 77-7) TaxID=1071380 RepID=I2H8E6_HENB6|nr:hypothetical protein TBLA_0H03660 [Tetrapisispora blattae CBS 6284]CCH62648.1 hypothetical protein TBLA_0H03660 [Tetrapisispora blattae CBS 6284]